MSKKFEETVRGTAEETMQNLAARKEIRGEFVVVIGVDVSVKINREED